MTCTYGGFQDFDTGLGFDYEATTSTCTSIDVDSFPDWTYAQGILTLAMIGFFFGMWITRK